MNKNVKRNVPHERDKRQKEVRDDLDNQCKFAAHKGWTQKYLDETKSQEMDERTFVNEVINRSSSDSSTSKQAKEAEKLEAY